MEEQGWGQFVLNPADVVGLTGVSSTSSVGSTTIGSAEFSISGQSATSSVGSITPADVIGLTGQSATSAVGSISPADVIGITGVSQLLLGSVNYNIKSFTAITGLSATTNVGSISPAIVQGLTGVSATFICWIFKSTI